jgi:hypothetical protein
LQFNLIVLLFGKLKSYEIVLLFFISWVFKKNCDKFVYSTHFFPFSSKMGAGLKGKALSGKHKTLRLKKVITNLKR